MFYNVRRYGRCCLLGEILMRRIFAPLLKNQLLLPAHIFQFILGVAAGRALLGGLAPFSSAYAAAAVFIYGKASWSAVLGVLWASQSLASAFSSCAVVFGSLVLRRWKKTTFSLPFLLVAALAVGVIHFIVKEMWVFFSGASISVVSVVCESLLVALLLSLFVCGTEFKEHKILLAVLFFVMIINGYSELQVASISLGEVFIDVVLLGTAFYLGPGGGAGAGVLLGLFTARDLWTVLPSTGIYAVTGFLAGVFRYLGTVLGFLLASLFFSQFYRDATALSLNLATALLAGVIFLCLPLTSSLFARGKKGSVTRFPLQAEIGFSQQPKSSEVINGDCFAFRYLTPNRLLLVLSDGMGAGINAARGSRTVVNLLGQLLENEISLQAAAAVVNTALYFQGQEDNVATIDLVVVDLQEGYADFLKAGAAPSYLKRGRNVEMIRSSCWPAGILEEIDPQILRYQVLDGDLLVVASDGITEVDESAVTPGAWLYRYLVELPLEEPQVVADLIVKNALIAGGYPNRDDMTVLVARFFTSGEAR
jgi:stage II sporulation protein E